MTDGYYDELETQLRGLTERGVHRRERMHVMPLMAFAATMVVVAVVAGVFLGVRGRAPSSQIPLTPPCASADWSMSRIPARSLDGATVAGASMTTKSRCRLRMTISFDLLNRAGALAGAVAATVNSIATPGVPIQRRWAWRNDCGEVGPFWFRLSSGPRSVRVPVSPPPCVDHRQSTGFALFELRSPNVLGERGIATVRFGTSFGHTLSAITNLLGVFGSRTSGPGCGVDTTEQLLDRNRLFFDRGRFVGYEYSGDFLATLGGLRVGDTLERARRLYGAAFTTSSAHRPTWSAAGLRGYLTSPDHGRIATIDAGHVGCAALHP